MKCKYCNGTGKRYSWMLDKRDECPYCDGTGEVTATNEEWFCSLSTEEKATFLAIQIQLGVEFYRTNDERYQNHAWWVKWLKEKHHD